MEIHKPSRHRRYHPEEFKQAVIDACCEPGVSVAGIALANGVNANQVRRWMRERGIEPPTRRVPMPVIEAAPGIAPAFV
jgi:transposase